MSYEPQKVKSTQRSEVEERRTIALVNANDLATVHYAIKFEGYSRLQRQMPFIGKENSVQSKKKKKEEFSRTPQGNESK